jgi:hypothetical protein
MTVSSIQSCSIDEIESIQNGMNYIIDADILKEQIIISIYLYISFLKAIL